MKPQAKNSKPPENQDSDLFNKALRLAKASRIEDLLQQTGLPLSWLQKFRAGKIKAPSVQRIETLIVKMGGCL